MSDEEALELIRSSLAVLESQSARSAEQIEKLTRERDEYRKLARLLEEANEKLKRGLLGQKAERLPKDDAQLSLAILRMALGTREAEGEADAEVELVEQKIPEHTRKKPVRKPLGDHVVRVPIEILPEEVKREGTEAFERIGEEKREVIERRPASTVVVQLIYPKFVRKDRQKDAATNVVVADRVELPIQRGSAGPGLLAETLVRR